MMEVQCCILITIWMQLSISIAFEKKNYKRSSVRYTIYTDNILIIYIINV